MIYANRCCVNLTFDQLQNEVPGMSGEASAGTTPTPAVPSGLPTDPTTAPDAPIGIDPETGLTPSPPSDPAPDAPTDTGPPSDTGPGGTGPAGTGPADAGTGPTGDGPSGGVFKRGGKIQQERGRQHGQRPDPRKLSAMLQQGSKVNVGDHDDETDDVPVVSTRGETVLNKNASDEFGLILERMNEWGRSRMGGFQVGAPRTRRR
jgi:hypothetical protein